MGDEALRYVYSLLFLSLIWVGAVYVRSFRGSGGIVAATFYRSKEVVSIRFGCMCVIFASQASACSWLVYLSFPWSYYAFCVASYVHTVVSTVPRTINAAPNVFPHDVPLPPASLQSSCLAGTKVESLDLSGTLL